jgi:SAM-dependent methyltransferase
MSATPIPDPRTDVGVPADDGVDPAEAAQRSVNERVWGTGRFLGEYASRGLRPVEVIVLAEYREDLRGRILELGCGAGRLTGYLAQLGTSTHGIDLAPAMVEYCRRQYPAATFSVDDLRDVGRFDPGSFDAVVAAYNVIDVVGDADRAAILRGIHQTLSPGGLLILSSHNRAVADRLGRGRGLGGRTLAGIAEALIRLPRRMRNRRRLRRFEARHAGYAILNDSAHDYSVLHYYIERDDQERQLERFGFELLACLDLDGQPVARGERAPWSPELHYVARRRP